MSTNAQENAKKIINNITGDAGNMLVDIYTSHTKVANKQVTLLKAMFDSSAMNYSKDELQRRFHKTDDKARINARDVELRGFVPSYAKDLTRIEALKSTKDVGERAERAMLKAKVAPFQVLYVRTLQVLHLLRSQNVKSLTVMQNGALSFAPDGDETKRRIVAMTATFKEASKNAGTAGTRSAGKVITGTKVSANDGIKPLADALVKTLHAIDAANKKHPDNAQPMTDDAKSALNSLFAALAARVDNAALAALVKAHRKPTNGKAEPQVVQRNGVTVVATSADKDETVAA